MGTTSQSYKQVVVVGAGFAGMSAVRKLSEAPVDIILLDQCNHHLFQPLLYQVATASLSPADISLPIRHILRKQRNVTVMMERVVSVDSINNTVTTNSGNRYDYDYLVLATGASHSYFGHDDWSDHAPGLKSLKDALFIREKILLAFEQAEVTNDPALKAEYLTFVIVGAGPTGVEMAGAVRELATESLAHEFKNINPKLTRVILIEAGPRILNSFPEKLAKTAEKKLLKMGTEIYTDKAVNHVGDDCVQASSLTIKTRTIIWAAGVKASKAAAWTNAKSEKDGRILVNPDLSVLEYPHIFAIGDTSACFDPKTEKYLPGVASVAKQQGAYVGGLISRKLQNKNLAPFRYRNYGNLATIGRKYAIADFEKTQMDGFLTYILWWAVHIYFLIGFRNRFIVFFNWAWSYFTFKRGARLILQESLPTK